MNPETIAKFMKIRDNISKAMLLNSQTHSLKLIGEIEKELGELRTELTRSEKTYFTHYNGSRPFMVCCNNNKTVTVYSQTKIDYEEDDPANYKNMDGSWKVKKIFI